MTVDPTTECQDGCGYAALTGTAADMVGNLDPKLAAEFAAPAQSHIKTKRPDAIVGDSVATSFRASRGPSGR